jgi:hypothetical protein
MADCYRKHHQSADPFSVLASNRRVNIAKARSGAALFAARPTLASTLPIAEYAILGWLADRAMQSPRNCPRIPPNWHHLASVQIFHCRFILQHEDFRRAIKRLPLPFRGHTAGNGKFRQQACFTLRRACLS